MNNTKTAVFGFLITSATLSTLFLSSAIAEVKPYVGFEVGQVQAAYKSGTIADYALDDSVVSLNPIVGLELTNWLAVEAGYLHSTTGSRSADYNDGVNTLSGDTDIKIKGVHLDVLGKYPLSEGVNLLGLVGVARLKADVDYTNVTGTLAAAASASQSSSETAARFGVGASYDVNDAISLRGMVRYMPVDFDGAADGLTQVSVGAAYKF